MSAYAGFFPVGGALGRDPNLPGAAGGQDAEYTAAEAQLRAEIQRRYADILQQLGYQGEGGTFMPGEVEAQAQRQRSELGRNRELAVEENTQQMQREGTLFSGLRAQGQARAEHPFVQALADLDVDVPKQLNRLYEDAGRTLQDYTIQNNILLADAASRAAARAAAAAAAAGWGGGGGGGGGGGDYDLSMGGSYDDLVNSAPIAPEPPQQIYVPTNPGWGAAQPKPKPPQEVYVPTNPGWGAAGTYAK